MSFGPQKWEWPRAWCLKFSVAIINPILGTQAPAQQPHEAPFHTWGQWSLQAKKLTCQESVSKWQHQDSTPSCRTPIRDSSSGVKSNSATDPSVTLGKTQPFQFPRLQQRQDHGCCIRWGGRWEILPVTITECFNITQMIQCNIRQNTHPLWTCFSRCEHF